jgi:hypothetical protein
VIAGFWGNSVEDVSFGATIAGGGAPLNPNLVSDRFGTIGGGADNVVGNEDGDSATATFATIGGGRANTASDIESTVGGGFSNDASGGASTIGGGFGNAAGAGDYATVAGGFQNTASGDWSVVGGGKSNVASGIDATVPGGVLNSALADQSFAAGTNAAALDKGAFVWADSQAAAMVSTGQNQFIARALGHFFLQSDSSLDDQGGFINTSTGGFLSLGGTWTNASSRRLKVGFAPVSPVGILEKVASLPLTSWHYKAQPGVRHIGPVSEDFHRAFGVGDNARSIGTVDADGVALAAIQGLYRENQRLRAQLRAQNARLTRLEKAVAARSR